MATKLISHFFSAFLLAIGCCSCECIGAADHAFEEQVLFEPEQIQYHIGDTILISSKFSCQGLFNLATGMTEDYCGLKNLGSSIQIHLLQHFPIDSLDFIYTLENFDYISLEGEVNPFNRYASDIKFQIKENEYGFKIGIIPKVVGKYLVFISDSGPAHLPGNERCETGGFGLLNRNIDNHIELLEAYSGALASDFERTHSYCFEVIP